nr:unnamed protein product [Callosobruchus chinensis]
MNKVLQESKIRMQRNLNTYGKYADMFTHQLSAFKRKIKNTINYKSSIYIKNDQLNLALLHKKVAGTAICTGIAKSVFIAQKAQNPTKCTSAYYECILWNISSPNYRNKAMRTAAEEIQKIENLRCTYNQQVRKIKKCKKSGAGVDGVYVPNIIPNSFLPTTFFLYNFLNVI